jgi:hypothetical protein
MNQLADRIDEATQWLEQNDKEGKIDIDAITDPKDPLSRQLLTLVAADATIEDTLYYLEKALGKSNINTDAFLKVIHFLFFSFYFLCFPNFLFLP